ncbi:MAG TPA: hypothetical protein VLT45_04830 [Kofleriaceae bacterium]|nr:hypothetical protein [Kofleriaceae bacterium]
MDAAQSEQPAIPKKGALRRAVPWLVGLAILVVIAKHVPVAEFRQAISHGPHVQLGLVALVSTGLILCTDSISTWIGLLALRIRRPLSHVFAVRGGSYVLFLVNYALGQGAFGYWLNRTGISGLRAVGVTLFLIGTNFATMLLVTTVTWMLAADTPAHAALWWTLVGGSGAFLVYLVIIAIAPRFVAKIQVLAPLFDGGVRGHVIAVVGRIPHIAMLVISYWAALRVWGIPVPLVAGLTLMPAVVIASVLPISPAGLGTTQAALVYFFSDYAVGATGDDRQAHVLAFAIVYLVYSIVSALVIGLACTPFAKRLGLLPSRKPPVTSGA